MVHNKWDINSLVYFGNQLNHHQAPVWDVVFDLIGDRFKYVEVVPPRAGSNKGSTVDYSNRPYLVKAWSDNACYNYAKQLSLSADVAVFGANSIDYQVFRLRYVDKLSFELSERWLKRGVISLFSPRLIKNQWYYHTLFYKKPLYKLCSSGYAAVDQNKLLSFKGRCYKWGYFPQHSESGASMIDFAMNSDSLRVMWCSRFIKLKHPEIPVLLAEKLKKRGYHFVIDMFGDGSELNTTKRLIEHKGLTDCVFLHGCKPNEAIIEEMRNHQIFLFTSDKREGWGAVANEAMANGCLLVSSNEIGSTPYLIKPWVTGCVFKSKRVASLEKEIIWIFEHPNEAQAIRETGRRYVLDYWSPNNAAKSLLKLSESLLHNRPNQISEGPCSLA